MISLNQRGQRVSAIAIVAVLVFATTGQYAFADNVQNDISIIPASVTINVGGSTSVGYRINSNNGDGQTGCNAADSSPATVTINVPAGVTRTPSSLIFTSCGTSQNVVFSSSTAGDYAITVNVSDSGVGTYNTNPAAFTLHVLAPTNTAPQLNLPPNITAEATGPSGAAVSYSVTSTDAEDNPDPTPSCTPASGSTFAIGQTTVNCSVTDSGGMSAQGSFKITVQDTTKPVLTVPADITLEATSASGATSTFTASAVDIVSGTLTPSCSPSSGSTFPLGSTVVTCSATDGSGNTGTKSFTVIVRDTVAPQVTVPASQTIEATSASGATVTYAGQSATDTVDGTSLPVSCTPLSGSTFVLGTTTVTCTATDSHGNTGSNSFSVTVEDTTAPVVTVPANQVVEATGPTGAVASFSSASAHDGVDGSIQATCTYSSGATFPIGSTTVSCSATDSHGNTGTNSFTITVQDTTAPVVTVPAPMTLEATGPSGAAATFSTSASDIVDGVLPVSCNFSSGSTFALGLTTITCSATDAHGHIGTNSFTITVVDTTAPVVTAPSPQTVEATGASGAAVTYSGQSATDSVDGSVSVSCTPASGSTFAIGTTTVSCSATDSHGNTGTNSFIVTVQDHTGPVITIKDGNGTPVANLAQPGHIVVEATSPSGAAATFSASGNDAVDGVVSASCDYTSGATFALGSTTVTCTSSDLHGNTSTATFVIDVVDTTAPTVNVPSDITKEATGPSGAAATFSTSASDIVDLSSDAVSCDYNSGDTFSLGTTTVSCSATDAHGNTGHASFVVTVEDTTPPTVTVPADITVEATSSAGAPVTFTASASDLVDGTDVVVCNYNSGDTFSLGSTTVSCTSTDSHGNSATSTFLIDVVDTTAPTISIPSDTITEATRPAGAVVTFSASASDIVDGSVAVSCTPASGSTFSLSSTTKVTCDTFDAHNNHSSATFTVTVQDTTAPTVTVPDNLTFEATGPLGAPVTFATSSFDIVDLASDVVSCDHTSGTTFPLGTTTVSCSATDAHGNKGSNTFTVTVHDTTAPAITVPADLTAEASGASGAAVTYSGQSATDLVDGSVSVICTPASGSTFALGTNTVSCSASDAHGNSATRSFTVTVQDTTAPTVTVPSNLIAEATGTSGASVTYSGQSASDKVDGSVAVACTPISGSTFAIGSTTVTCTATDAHHNTGSGTFTVTVRDTTAPAIASHANIALFTTSSSGSAVNYAVPTATDVVDGSVTVSCTPASGSTFALGTTTVSCSVTDAHGNTASSTFTVTVTKWSGILQPVNADGSSVFKLKSTVPVKVQLFQNDGVTPDSTATVRISIVKYSNNVEGTFSEATSTSAATTGNLFRYDTTSNQYIFNWGTNGLSTGTWLLKVTVNGNDVITNTKPTNPTPTGYTVEVSLR